MSSQSFPITKTAAEWREILNEKEYEVIRNKGTEPSGTGEFTKKLPEKGHFACRACNNPLYSAKSKFDAGCGWPSFDRFYESRVATRPDLSGGRERLEIVCAKCGGHLGHIFEGEKHTTTNVRHCVNSISVRYHESDGPNDAEI